MSENKLTLGQAVTKLKELLFSKGVSEEIVTTEQSFKDAKLEDGVTIVRYDADVLATGVVVNLLDETGQVLPLPKGDYVLEDGTTFTVVDDLGTADNVVLAPEETEEEAPKQDGEVVAPVATSAAPEPAKAAPKRVIKSQVEEHVFNAFKEEITKTVSGLTEKLKSFELENIELKKQVESNKEINKEMFSIVEKIAEAPASQPTETKEKFNVSKARLTFRNSIAELEAKMTNENAK